jgi:hypothetical protein
MIYVDIVGTMFCCFHLIMGSLSLVIRDIDILHTLHIKEYTQLGKKGQRGKLGKEKRQRDQLNGRGTTSQSLGHH